MPGQALRVMVIRHGRVASNRYTIECTAEWVSRFFTPPYVHRWRTPRDQGRGDGGF